VCYRPHAFFGPHRLLRHLRRRALGQRVAGDL